MLKRLSFREKFEQLIADFEPLLRNAFMESVADIKSNIQIKRIVERLERNDIAGAIEALYLDPAAFRPLDRAIAQAYEGGGVAAVSNLPTLRDPFGSQLVVRFDVRNPRAEQWLTQHSTNLVTNIIEDQKVAARKVLVAGLEAGNNPRATALELVGRLSRATGRREGGILGLTSIQAEYAITARSELASGDTAALRHYLTRGRRDKRFDRTILKHINDGTTPPSDLIGRIVGRYEDGLLKLRGDTIARTETLTSLNASNQEAFRQGLDKTNYTEQDVTRVWRTANDERVRHSHSAMNGQEVKGLNTPYVLPDGSMMMYPGDSSLGASASQIINCRCTQFIRLDFLKGID